MRLSRNVLSFLLASVFVAAGGQLSSAAASESIQLYSGTHYTGASVSVPPLPQPCADTPFAVRSLSNLSSVDIFLFSEPGCRGSEFAVTSLHLSATTPLPYRSYLVKYPS
ncbi:hypothetical protein GCM10027598_82740 [Amycolatopsis oliviviridis]|uniref:Secreted protein n=1 Tax=Amycolatopsis oliviviridis TaxID=1471590 RepID=A0ABQ3L6L5_9PSEU|nr:hypothetical protein [Amycolatopsis oliviviridis]GHH06741.1 hypothetical protein GCM10017790_12640 [Amycolatopsis oliviviridis]